MSPDVDRFRGALLGLAVGDAVGTTVEFRPPGTFAPVTDMVGGGPFRLPAGAWTDDTSMALCLAESLLAREGFDPVDQLSRYVRWFRDGYLSSTGAFFDIGTATRAALGRFERTGEPFPGDANPDAAGNGPLMRLAPVALAYANHPEQAVSRAAESARTTHGAQAAIDACRYFCGLLVGALTGTQADELLRRGPFEPYPDAWTKAPLCPEIAEIAAGSFLRREPPEIKGSGYVVRTLEAALWAAAKGASFEEGLLLAVNLGDDADTTGAIYGQLAGALFGVDAIPERWRDRIVMRDLIEKTADGLLSLSKSAKPAAPVERSGVGESGPEPEGPPGDSYWVLPSQLLAGPYPGAPRREDAAEKLEAFLDAGVTCFIDLTEEGEGPPLAPYSRLLHTVAGRRSTRVTHLRMPIRDVTVPPSWHVRAVLAAIRAAIAEGETVYLHCWGGVGRTGTIVGCLLVENGISAEAVLDDIAKLRSQTSRAGRISPETEEQRLFVREWSAADTLVLDQQALDRLDIQPMPQDREPIPSADEIVALLKRGEPVVINGPQPGWCVQAVANQDGAVRIEVLDPAHWEKGPALPAGQQQVLQKLGFTREPGVWLLEHAAEEATPTHAAKLMLTVAEQAWGLAPRDAICE
jgi:ADP-ribosylglycohydrolase